MEAHLDSPYNQKFTWDSIGHINLGRNHLGDSMPVSIYRLFQFTMKDILIQSLGIEETISLFRSAGELAGTEFATNLLDLTQPFNIFIAQLQELLELHKIGILRIESFDFTTGHAVLTIGEDLDCSGLPITGETVCHYDEGFLAGIFKVYTQKPYVVTEIDCWCTGSRVCRFEANIPL